MDKNPEKLLDKYLTGQCTEKEKAIVESWYLTMEDLETAPSHEMQQRTKKIVWKKLAAHIGTVPRVIFRWQSVAAAALIFVVLSFGLYFYLFRHQPAGEQIAQQDLLPGADRAVLTLADGRRISLDQAAIGTLASEQGVKILKGDNGDVVYDASNEHRLPGAGNTVALNMITIPRGGQYRLVLPDGSKVWLNAASSLKFPVSFTGAKREVEVNGEAYFEVFHDPDHPFIVHANQMNVEVKGTHFNINSYLEDHLQSVTLLEGAVNVNRAGTTTRRLAPGQQAIFTAVGESPEIRNLSDAEDVVAWKTGYFVFNKEPIEQVMRELSRWYNVDIIYSGSRPTVLSTGSIPRNAKASTALAILEDAGGVHFEIKDGKIIVNKR